MSYEEFDFEALFTFDGSGFEDGNIAQASPNLSELFNPADNGDLDHDDLPIMGETASGFEGGSTHQARSVSSSLTPVPEELEQNGPEHGENSNRNDSADRSASAPAPTHDQSTATQSNTTNITRVHSQAPLPHAHPEPPELVYPPLQQLFGFDESGADDDHFDPTTGNTGRYMSNATRSDFGDQFPSSEHLTNNAGPSGTSGSAVNSGRVMNDSIPVYGVAMSTIGPLGVAMNQSGYAQLGNPLSPLALHTADGFYHHGSANYRTHCGRGGVPPYSHGSPAIYGGPVRAAHAMAYDHGGHSSRNRNTVLQPRGDHHGVPFMRSPLHQVSGIIPQPTMPDTLEPDVQNMAMDPSHYQSDRLFQDMGSNVPIFSTQTPARGLSQPGPILPSTPAALPVESKAFQVDSKDDVFGGAGNAQQEAGDHGILSPMNNRLRFGSIQEAEAAARSHIPKDFVPVLDSTFPATAQDEYAYATRLFDAMMDCTNAEDNTQMVEQWQRNTKHEIELIEIRVWEVLRRMIDYFKQPGFLKTRHHYPSGLKKSSTFGAHMDEVVFALERNKTICRHFMTESYIDGLIDDPRGSVLRVQNNRKVNAEKKKKAVAGQQALEQVRSVSREVSQGSSVLPAANGPGTRLATSTTPRARSFSTLTPQAFDNTGSSSSNTRTPGTQMARTPDEPPRKRKRTRDNSDDSEASTRSARRTSTGNYLGSPTHRA